MRILSLFNCKLQDIKDVLPLVKEQGFDAVQISPLQRTKDEYSDKWWMLYQPINFEIGNKLGSKEDLMELCDAARRNGLIIIADTVFNHLASENNEGSLIPHHDCDKDLLYEPNCWKERKQLTNWHDRYQVTHYCMSLPGLNPDNTIVQQKVINMLNEYADLGVDGFRFDAAKSIALPEEGCDFFKTITYNLNRWMPIIYGEVLFADPELIDKYAKYMQVLTNSDTHNKDAVIRFVENKDTFLSKDLGWTRNFPADKINNDYYWLAGNYPNTLFYDREGNDQGQWKKELIKRANKR
jgi:alpha-amylase